MEKISKIDTLIVDKTGTITKGNLDVIDIQSFSRYTPDQVLQFAAETEKCSEHPFAKAIIEEAFKKGLELKQPDGFEHYPGLGVCISRNGVNILTGSKHLMHKYDVKITLEAEEYIVAHDKYSVVFVAEQQTLLGAICLSDQPRENVKNILDQVKERGISQVVMLTGDNSKVAGEVAVVCGIDKVIAELVPADKVDKIRDFKSQGSCVAMVGDGVNDAPALAQADVGVAMGLSGTEVTMEAAGVVLVSDDLAKLPQMLKIGKITMLIIKQNIGFALLVNIIGIALSSQGLISPLLASIIHESNALIVMANSLRLLKVK